MLTFVDQRTHDPLIWVLSHFVWQASVIAGCSALAAFRLRAASRYWIYVASLALIAVCPLAMWCAPTERSFTQVDVDSRDPQFALPRAVSATAIPYDARSSKPIEMASVTGSIAQLVTTTARVDLSRYASLAVDLYLLCVLIMLGRLLIGWRHTTRLRRELIPVEHSLQQLLDRQCRMIGLTATPIMAYSTHVIVPTVIGVLKPTILLPLGLASGLTPQQFEMILTHELAHLRRYDQWVQLFQSVIEAVFFFHPVIWWLSQQIRIERENCCDDLAMAHGTSPIDYANSLLRVAEQSRVGLKSGQPLPTGLSVLGQPSRLQQRIARILNLRPMNASADAGRVVPCCAFAVTIIAMCACLLLQRSSVAEDLPLQPATAAAKASVEERQHSEPPQAVSESANRDKPSADAQQEPVKADEVEVQNRLDDLVQEAIEVTAARQLRAENHSPWQIMQVVKAFGLEGRLKSNLHLQGMSVGDWLANNPTFFNEPVWQVTRFGVQAHPYSKKYFFQGHPGQFLAYMAQANVPADFLLLATDATGAAEQFRVSDVVADLEQQIDPSQEVTWVLWALSHYEPIDAEWTDTRGEKWSIERLVAIEVEKPISHSPDRGSPRLMALANSLNKYRRSAQSSLPPIWQRVDQKLKDHIPYAQLELTSADRRDKDLNERVHLRGTSLSWLMMVLTDEQLREEWVEQAIEKAAKDLIENRQAQIDTGPLFYEAHALRMFLERRAGAVPVH